MCGGGGGGERQRNGGKSYEEERREALCWSCGDSHRPHPSPLPPSPLPSLPATPNPVPRSLVLPTSSPGNKDFHSCAWGDPQQGRRGEKDEKEEGGNKVGRFEDHRDQDRSLKLCAPVCVFSAWALTNGLLFQIWWQPCHSMHILGKFGGNVLKLAPIQDSNTGTNTAAEYAWSLKTQIFPTKSPLHDMFPPCWARSGVRPPEHLSFRLL